jgi:hypothetical protein
LIWVFLPVVFIGVLRIRAVLLVADHDGEPYGPSNFTANAVVTILMLSVIAWGFGVLPWYWPPLAIVISAGLAQVIVSIGDWNRWRRLLPALNVAAFVSSLVPWLLRWPFD